LNTLSVYKYMSIFVASRFHFRDIHTLPTIAAQTGKLVIVAIIYPCCRLWQK